ncbi:MAG: Cof-type HAD-IIB family hydrolase [Eubacterium sp.]
MINKEIRVAFFDIDGTLASHMIRSENFLERVPESARKTLKQLSENDVLPVIVTGRERSVIKQFVKDLGMDTYIAANGQSITYKGEEIYKNLLEPAVILEALRQLESITDVSVVLETARGNVLCQSGHGKAFHFIEDIERHKERAADYEVYQIAIIGEELREKIHIKIEGMKTKIVAPIVMDILPEAISKASAIKKMLSLLGLEKSNAIAFGDEENDTEMFDAVSYTVAMGNAIEALKKKATYVTDTVDDDGVYKACLHLGLIKA